MAVLGHQDEPVGAGTAAGRVDLRGELVHAAVGPAEDVHQVAAAGDHHRVGAAEGKLVGDRRPGTGAVVPAGPGVHTMQARPGGIGLKVIKEVLHTQGGSRQGQHRQQCRTHP